MKRILTTALTQIGIEEIKGSEHNQKVLKYFKAAGFEGVRNDETAWCAAFVNWVLVTNNLKPSGKLTARSLLGVGTATTEPEQGDIVVLWREKASSWKGHVGIFIREEGNLVYILGGNQSNKVCIKPYARRRLLGYRRLGADKDFIDLGIEVKSPESLLIEGIAACMDQMGKLLDVAGNL